MKTHYGSVLLSFYCRFLWGRGGVGRLNRWDSGRAWSPVRSGIRRKGERAPLSGSSRTGCALPLRWKFSNSVRETLNLCRASRLPLAIQGHEWALRPQTFGCVSAASGRAAADAPGSQVWSYFPATPHKHALLVGRSHAFQVG